MNCVNNMRQDGAILTHYPLLRLTPLSTADVDAYYALLDRNRAHLTQHGDYLDVLTATRTSVWDELGTATENLVLGIWLDQELIGRVDLIPKAPEIFVIGYWLGSDYVGHGRMTVACQALVAHARAALGATTIYAGVTNGNRTSEAVLKRLGFGIVQDMGSYHRFRLELDR